MLSQYMKIFAVIFCGCIILMTFNLNVHNEFNYKFHNLETKRPFILLLEREMLPSLLSVVKKRGPNHQVFRLKYPTKRTFGNNLHQCNLSNKQC